MQKKKRLYEAFCGYIDSCKELSKILWDAISSMELLMSNTKQSHFIRRFKSTEEFKNLLKALEDFDPKRLDETDVDEYYQEHHQYKLSISGRIQRFFINAGIYDMIIAGEEFNKDNAFAIFLEKLEEKDIEVLEYGEVFPLKIEMEKDQVLELEDFSLLTDVSKYNINDCTKFVFLLQRFVRSQHLGSIEPYIIPQVSVRGETPFSVSLFILNLYFEKPVYIPIWYKSHSNLLSFWYQPQRKSSKFSESIRDKFYSDLIEKYDWDAYNASSDKGYTDWDKWDDFIFKKEEEFINSGQGPVNYLRKTEIAKFKEFIAKIRDFF